MKKILLAGLILLTARSAAAQERWRFSAESDPVDFLNGGYALYLGVKPPDLPRLRLGLGTFALDFPQAATDLVAGEHGWLVRARWSLLGYASLYFDDARRGFYVGLRTFVTSLRYRRADAPGEDQVLHLFAGPEVGYQWFPFGDVFYVQPWAGLEVDLVRGHTPAVAGRQLPGARLLPLALVYFGVEL
ncbi:MAG: hypothetical protein NVS2B9_17660 [Myxococcales bacterium]